MIKNKWVYRIKTNSNSEITRYKARLVAKGYTQQKGIDYDEMFVPVVRYDSVRVLLAIAVESDMNIRQFDVQTAFLYGNLDKTIYMEQPSGYEDVRKPNFVCQLKKSIYGLKQASRCWNTRFVNFLKTYKFKQLKTDWCVFVGKVNDTKVYMAHYVDDGLILSNSNEAIDSFEIVIGDAKQYVGLEIEQDIANHKISVSQRGYIRNLLTKFNMLEAKPASVPVEPGLFLETPDNSGEADNHHYREVVGFLLFLSTVSRPDIAYSVSQASRFLCKWNFQHWLAVKRIMRYLVKTIDYKIVFRKTGNMSVTGYPTQIIGDAEKHENLLAGMFSRWQAPQSPGRVSVKASLHNPPRRPSTSPWLQELKKHCG